MAATARASAPAASTQRTAAAVKTTGREKVRWPYLSDHVFFEVMAPYMIEGPSPAPRAVPVRRTAAPVAERVDVRATPTVDLTSSFRVIECLPGSQVPSALPDVRPANSNEAAMQPAAVAIPAVASNAISIRAMPAPEETVPVPVVRVSSPLPMTGKIVSTTTGGPMSFPRKSCCSSRRGTRLLHVAGAAGAERRSAGKRARGFRRARRDHSCSPGPGRHAL